MALITDPVTGITFDADHLDRNPYKKIPGTALPCDMEGVDILFPEPSPTDPDRDEKNRRRAQAIADVKLIEKAQKAAAKP